MKNVNMGSSTRHPGSNTVVLEGGKLGRLDSATDLRLYGIDISAYIETKPDIINVFKKC